MKPKYLTEVNNNNNKQIAEADNFEVEITNNSNKLYTFVQKLLKEIKETKEEEKDEENLDCTDSIVDTTKKSLEELIFFFQNKTKNFDIPEAGKIALRTLSNLIAVITAKYSIVKKKIKS